MDNSSYLSLMLTTDSDIFGFGMFKIALKNYTFIEVRLYKVLTEIHSTFRIVQLC